MNDKYEIRHWLDNEYGVYLKGMGDCLFKGTISEVNAWLDLKAKGFDL